MAVTATAMKKLRGIFLNKTQSKGVSSKQGYYKR